MLTRKSFARPIGFGPGRAAAPAGPPPGPKSTRQKIAEKSQKNRPKNFTKNFATLDPPPLGPKTHQKGPKAARKAENRPPTRQHPAPHTPQTAPHQLKGRQPATPTVGRGGPQATAFIDVLEGISPLLERFRAKQDMFRCTKEPVEHCSIGDFGIGGGRFLANLVATTLSRRRCRDDEAESR